MKVMVMGYYHRKNLGDDVFGKVFSDYLVSRNYTPIVENIDDILEIPDDVSCIIFGGGDLINTYFIDKLNQILENSYIYKNKKIPIYALGIGIPYASTVQQGYLDRFDYIATRSCEDVKLLHPIYGERSSYSPDLSLLLPKNFVECNFPQLDKKSKKIGIFLARTLYTDKNPQAYENICDQLSYFFLSLLEKQKKTCYSGPEYELYLIPFCTEDKDKHDDRIINNHIYGRLSSFENIHLMNDEINVDNIRSFFSFFDYTICTRFHAHMFSLISEIPFLSIYTTKKVENILVENNYSEYSIKMEIEPEFEYPISVDSSLCIKRFKDLEDNCDKVRNNLKRAHNKYENDIQIFLNKIDNLLFEMPIYQPNHIEYLINSKVKKITDILISHQSLCIRDDIVFGKGSISDYFKDIDKKKIVQLISLELIGKKDSSYTYGLEEQIFNSNYCLYESVKWILEDMYENFSKKTPLNIDLNNDTPFVLRKIRLKKSDIFQGFHRSGWSYVLSNLKNYHNDKGIIFDSYLDRTFGWDSDILSFVKDIPYSSSWVGVLHHTNIPEYTEFDLSSCLSNPNFIESLPYCKGIIVLSENNKKYLETKLDVPIYKLYHPTELNVDKFDYKKFINSSIKNIVQIGAWLRDSYAIYDLKVPDNYVKKALKGKNMDNYFISDEIWDTLIKYIQSSKNGGDECVSGHIVEGKYMNKYKVGLLKSITKERDSVFMLSDLDNDEYDILLKNNIVFLNLVDAAAVNTIIECIVRNTPIIVNRLPATEEYLGVNYPLFYDNIREVKSLLNDKKIMKGYKYLKKMDKKRLSIEYFLKSLTISKLYQDI